MIGGSRSGSLIVVPMSKAPTDQAVSDLVSIIKNRSLLVSLAFVFFLSFGAFSFHFSVSFIHLKPCLGFLCSFFVVEFDFFFPECVNAGVRGNAWCFGLIFILIFYLWFIWRVLVAKICWIWIFKKANNLSLFFVANRWSWSFSLIG